MIITILYILLMIAGLAWLAWKIKLYVEKERDRESRLDAEMLYDDSLKSYLEDMKKKTGTSGVKNPATDSNKLESK